MSNNLIERIAVAWLHHQGYTDEELAEFPGGFVVTRAAHEAFGCEFDGNHQCWVCTDENGKSNHPTWDAIVEASEMANVVVEALGLTDEHAVRLDLHNPDRSMVLTDECDIRSARKGFIPDSELVDVTRWVTGWVADV